jgi:hypothetical protein
MYNTIDDAPNCILIVIVIDDIDATPVTNVGIQTITTIATR